MVVGLKQCCDPAKQKGKITAWTIIFQLFNPHFLNNHVERHVAIEKTLACLRTDKSLLH